jgi:hypothetical protein
VTDRDPFTARPDELDEHPDSFTVPSEDGVSLSCRKQFSNLLGIAPTRWCRTHARNIAGRRREGRSAGESAAEPFIIKPQRRWRPTVGEEPDPFLVALCG